MPVFGDYLLQLKSFVAILHSSDTVNLHSKATIGHVIAQMLEMYLIILFGNGRRRQASNSWRAQHSREIIIQSPRTSGSRDRCDSTPISMV